MSADSSFTSWIHSYGDRSEQLQTTTKDVPNCGICLEKVSDPIALKCGHVFDKNCIKKCLAPGISKCPYDRKDANEAEFKERPDIYESTKCQIQATVFSKTGSLLIRTEASIFSTMEKVQEKITTQYLRDSGEKEVPAVRLMTVRGSFKFYPEKTLADYEVLPGDETLMFVFLV